MIGKKKVYIYRLQAKFFDGFQWDLKIAATGMDWVTLWVTKDNGHLIEKLSIIEFCDTELWVSSGFAMAKSKDETLDVFIQRVEKSQRNNK